MGKFKKEYDVIVVGGGINGLTAASYLQKSGLDVAVFERRDELGTHCNTEELGVPGVRYNMHASGMMTLASPAYKDLELERFGLEMLTSSEWGYFNAFLDKTAVMFHLFDANPQYEAWKRMNVTDAEKFRRLSVYMGPHWVELIHRVFYEIPSNANLEYFMEFINKCPEVPRGWENMDGFEIVEAMFEDERIKTAVLSCSGVLDAWPWQKLIGPIGVILLGCFTLAFGWCYTARGGSHAIPHALARCFMNYGGSVMQACPVDKIIIENGEAKGVVLSKHAVYPEAEIRAKKAVISNLTPGPTFLDLVGEEHLAPEVVSAVKGYDYGNSVITVHYVLSEPPNWIQLPKFPEVERAMVFNIVESIDVWRRIGKDRQAGILSDPPICDGGCFQGFAMADHTQAPEGLHTLHLWPLLVADPKNTGGFENWDAIRESYADKVEDLVAEHVPNLKKATVSRLVYTPLDIYRRNASAILGCWGGGSIIEEQFYLKRPFEGCGAPRTPISKLYISQSIGSCPGATSLHCGYIAASGVAEDLGIRNQDWWKTKALEPYIDYCDRVWKRKYNPVVG